MTGAKYQKIFNETLSVSQALEHRYNINKMDKVRLDENTLFIPSGDISLKFNEICLSSCKAWLSLVSLCQMAVE